jgi:two-component system OmpR family response regulator/two-component system response regulator CpxR
MALRLLRMETMDANASSAKVLLIDDDVELVGLLRDYLERDGFQVGVAHDGQAGTQAALSGRYDIIVLDVMMPGASGIRVLSDIRAASPIPVLMLTARGDDADRIMGLELGADDYVPKPCTPRELAARLRAILKRARHPPIASPALIVGSLVLRPGLRLAELNGRNLPLTSTEFSLLEILARHAGQPVGKAALSEKALGRPLARFDRSIDVHIKTAA